jgi:rhamnogalacturonan endolyase
MQTTVFRDGFDSLQPGAIPVHGKEDPAVYYRPGMGTAGEWTVATSLRQEGFNEAWEIRRENGKNILAQTFSNLNLQNEPLSLITHPIIVTGDSLWSDYMIEADFTPLAKFDKCGIVFGYQHPNEFYFFGTEGNTVVLKHIQQSLTPLRPIERILAYRPVVWTPGKEMKAVVTVRRHKISTVLNDSIRMYEGAELISPGRIGLISDLPARFSRVEVKVLKGEVRKLRRRKRQIDRKNELLLKSHPAMVKWKTLNLEGLGASQNIRLGDLTGDGNKEILVAAEGDVGEIRCITAIDLDGNRLWQYGSIPDRPGPGEELPFQIHDLDGDGSREILFAKSGSMFLLNGRQGELITRVSLPAGFTPRSVVFADLLGTGRDNCLIITDCNRKLIVMNEQLETLWEKDFEGGSYPVTVDMEGDGFDEVLIGYSAFDHDGNLLFNIGKFIGDRCNGINLTRLRWEGREIPCILYAAGDWGLMYVDFEGNLLKQNMVGHVSYATVADFDMEAPGLEVVTSNSWGSDGLIHVMEADGNVGYRFMPSSGVSRCVPVNWNGDGEEFFLLSADTVSGGMFDRLGQLSVRFPPDDHPVLCHAATDLYGDARDEILVWDRERLWIYTQDDNPRMGKTYDPDRIPVYDYSMHMMSRSLPGW